MPMYDNVKKYVYRFEGRKTCYLLREHHLAPEEIAILQRTGIFKGVQTKPEGQSIEDLIEQMERNNERE